MEGEDQDTAQLRQQDSPDQTGQASSGARIAGDPTVGSGGYARLKRLAEKDACPYCGYPLERSSVTRLGLVCWNESRMVFVGR
jgi:hypothetical protein